MQTLGQSNAVMMQGFRKAALTVVGETGGRNVGLKEGDPKGEKGAHIAADGKSEGNTL